MSLDVTEKNNSCLNSHTVDQAAFVILCQNKKRCPDICVRINTPPKALTVFSLSWFKSCAL